MTAPYYPPRGRCRRAFERGLFKSRILAKRGLNAVRTLDKRDRGARTATLAVYIETITDSLGARRGSLEHNPADLLACLGLRLGSGLGSGFGQRLLRSKTDMDFGNLNCRLRLYWCYVK